MCALWRVHFREALQVLLDVADSRHDLRSCAVRQLAVVTQASSFCRCGCITKTRSDITACGEATTARAWWCTARACGSVCACDEATTARAVLRVSR